MLEHLASQSFLDFHRRILIEANLNHIRDHPLDHGLSEASVLNLQALDHRGNYDREMSLAHDQIHRLFDEDQNPFNLNDSMNMNEKDQIIYWAVESKNP